MFRLLGSIISKGLVMEKKDTFLLTLGDASQLTMGSTGVRYERSLPYWEYS